MVPTTESLSSPRPAGRSRRTGLWLLALAVTLLGMAIPLTDASSFDPFYGIAAVIVALLGVWQLWRGR